MTSNGGGWKKESTGSVVWWDLQSVRPPPHHQFMDHLLGSHRAMRTGLFSLSPPTTLRAHGTEPLADAAYDYIVKSKLVLQQSISPGKPRHWTDQFKLQSIEQILVIRKKWRKPSCINFAFTILSWSFGVVLSSHGMFEDILLQYDFVGILW
jgi:hypothetical protein